MARQLKRLDSNNIITAIRKDNKLFTSAKKMNEVLKNFYEDLYMTTCSAGDKELFLPEGKATATVFRGKG